MRLQSIKIQKFRNFVEAQRIEIESDVTCLVGKNESGKTTVLRALHRLNPAKGSDQAFDLVTEYPRWRLARDRREDSNLQQTRPIEATYELDEADLEAMEEIFEVRPPSRMQLHAARNYGGAQIVWVACDSGAIIQQAAADVQISGEDLKVLIGSESCDAAIKISKETAKGLKESGEALRAKAMGSFASALNKYQFIYNRTATLEQRNAMWALIPRFFYFSNYNVLPGETDLNDLQAKIDSGTELSESERSVVALLAHAQETPGDFMDADYDSRKAELQAASVDLSQRVFEYWKQNRDLDVIFDTDNVMVTEPNGQRQPHRILKIELRDGRHGNVETNFSTRSTGFQWFFSFFAAFSEYQSSSDPIIVLLDEPGTSLHGEAQSDFVRFIFEELGASKQTMYTTHSQHMVDPTKYEKLRAVHDRATREDPDQGVRVTPIELSADPATILPVESALGYSVSQHLFLGSGQHLTVEGSSDFVYLQRVTEHLLTTRDSGLDPRLAILPVGGIDNMPAFVALLGRRLSVSALVDGARTSAKVARITSAAEHNGVSADNIVVCADVAGMPTNADIEDLFDPSDYLRLFNWAFDDEVKTSDLPSTSEPIVKKLTDLKGRFDHALPAHELTMRREEFFASVKPKTLSQFKDLFARLNATTGSQ
jgi:energy-coupling factor transporter ATP-binding protein EcfA2